MVSINFNKTNLFSGLNLKQPQIQLNKKEELTLKIDSTIGDTFTPTAKTQEKDKPIANGKGTIGNKTWEWARRNDGQYYVYSYNKKGKLVDSFIISEEKLKETLDKHNVHYD